MATKKATEINVEDVKKVTKKVTKKAAETVEKATEKAADAAKKTVKKAASKVAKAEVVIQFAGRDIAAKDVLEVAKKDFAEKNSAALKEITLYVKPEENAAYYVANGDITGKVAL